MRGTARLTTYAATGVRARAVGMVVISFVALVADGGTTKVGAKKVNLPDAFGIDVLGWTVRRVRRAPTELTSGQVTIQ